VKTSFMHNAPKLYCFTGSSNDDETSPTSAGMGAGSASGNRDDLTARLAGRGVSAMRVMTPFINQKIFGKGFIWRSEEVIV